MFSSQVVSTPSSIRLARPLATPSSSKGEEPRPRRRCGSSVTVMPLANTGWPSLSFRNEVPRAIEGPEMAPISGLSSEAARRFSKITGAVVEAILRAPSRPAARRPASAPMASGVGQVGLPADGAAVVAGLHAARRRRRWPRRRARRPRRGAGRRSRRWSPSATGRRTRRPSRRRSWSPWARRGRRPRRSRALGLQRLGRGLGGIVEVEVGQRRRAPAGPGRPGRRRGLPARAGPWPRSALDQLGAGLGADVGAGDAWPGACRRRPAGPGRGLSSRSTSSSSPSAHGDGKGPALGAHGLGGVGAGGQRGGHHVVQQVFVHARPYGRADGRRQAGSAALGDGVEEQRHAAQDVGEPGEHDARGARQRGAAAARQADRVRHPAGEQRQADGVDHQRRRPGHGQHGHGDQAGRHIFRGVAEGADRLGQLRDVAVAEHHAVLAPLAHHQHRQHQQQDQVQADPERGGVGGRRASMAFSPASAAQLARFAASQGQPTGLPSPGRPRLRPLLA